VIKATKGNSSLGTPRPPGGAPPQLCRLPRRVTGQLST